MITGRIKKWSEFQHYKDRSPPWIKLERKLLDDYEFACLPLASKALAPFLWLLASESHDGTVRVDHEWLAFRLRWNVEEVKQGLIPLINKGFVIVASDVLAECLQDACLEGEGEGETERETSSNEDVSAADETAAGPDPCPHSEIIAAYHELLPELPRVRTWDADRQKLLRTRWRDSAERQVVSWWREFFVYVKRCPFLMGQAQQGDRDPFLADLEWLVRPKNFRKVIEGKYESRRAA